MKQICVPVSPGELLDKITILEIKSDRFKDDTKRKNVAIEKSLLASVAAEQLPTDPEIDALIARLRELNTALWDVEEDLRRAEQDGDFGDLFVELARSVYQLNDERAAVKRAINVRLGSTIVEEKSYTGTLEPE